MHRRSGQAAVRARLVDDQARHAEEIQADAARGDTAVAADETAVPPADVAALAASPTPFVETGVTVAERAARTPHWRVPAAEVAPPRRRHRFRPRRPGRGLAITSSRP
jgi:hypothetical protein